jgi:uncharacterized membrane protein
MNYNIAAYIVYLILTVFIIVYVGKLFYRNGRVFILALMKNDTAVTDHINNILLVAYYLFNIGYAFLKLKFWQPVNDPEELISSIANNMSVLIFILALTHYINMLLIWYLSSSKKSFLTFKKFQS